MSGAAFERVLDALHAHGSRVLRREGGRSAMAQCPAHEDGNPSLSVTTTETRARVHCFAGCKDTAVLDALGLAVRDLYNEPRGSDLANYGYTDLQGLLVRTVHRGEGKTFRQSGQTRGTAPLYRLPAVAAAVAAGRPVYLVEGEEDVHALEELGAVATTAPMGAKSFRRADVTPLAGAHVIAVPDRDDAGRRWLADVRAHLDGVADTLEVRLTASGKDASDHHAAGNGLEQLVPVDAGEPAAAGEEPAARRLVLTSAASIKPRRVKWLWDGRIALGTLALLAGPEGLGKSTLAYWLAGRITRGELPGELHGTPRAVLVCATEDSWEHTIVPRLMAAGADLERVYRVDVLNAEDIHLSLALPRDVAATEEAAKSVRAGLLLLDPLMSRLDASLDAHRDGEVRRALEPLASLADRADLAVLGLIHHNKSGSTDPLQLVMASKAFTAVARSVHSVIRDPDDDTEARRLFGTPKNNLGRTDLPTLAFAVAGHPIETDDGTAWTGRIDWLGEVEGTIREAMGRSSADPGERTATSEAAEWLEDYLVSQGGEAPKVDVEKAGRSAGHHPQAVRRARERLRVTHRRQGFPAASIWALPTPSSSRVTSTPISRVNGPRGDTSTDMTDTTGSDQQGCNGMDTTVESSRVSHVSTAGTPRARDTTDQVAAQAALKVDLADRWPTGVGRSAS